MSKKFKGGWLIALIAFAIVGSIAFFFVGEQFGGSGWVSTLIFLTILLGFVAVSSWGSNKEQPEDEEDE